MPRCDKVSLACPQSYIILEVRRYRFGGIFQIAPSDNPKIKSPTRHFPKNSFESRSSVGAYGQAEKYELYLTKKSPQSLYDAAFSSSRYLWGNKQFA